MTSGLPNREAWSDGLLDASDEQLDIFVREAPFESVPGEFEYAGFGYVILGQIVEKIAGQSLQDSVTEHFLEPLGMERTSWEPLDSDYAQGHHEGRVVQHLRDGAFAPLGGLWSTPQDIARWAGFYLDADSETNESSPPLSKQSRKKQQERNEYLGLLKTNKKRFPHHAGYLPGYASAMIWGRSEAKGLVVCTANGVRFPKGFLTSQMEQVISRSNRTTPQMVSSLMTAVHGVTSGGLQR